MWNQDTCVCQLVLTKARLPPPHRNGEVGVLSLLMGFSGGSVVKNSPANADDTGSVSEFRKSPGGRHGNSLQDSCLETPMDRGAWQL